MYKTPEELSEAIARSPFRSRFHLDAKDKAYVRSKGRDRILQHASDCVSKRLTKAHLPNDGKQTPMRGHPVFKAQHACGCCCRGCLRKWHGIDEDHDLTPEEQAYVVRILSWWIDKEMEK